MLNRVFARGLMAAFVATGTAACAAAQEIPEPFKIPEKTTADALPVAGWLETVFQSQVRQCNDSAANVTLRKKDKSKPVSFVPNRIVNHLDLYGKENPRLPAVISVRNGSPLAQEFLFVYETKDGKREISSGSGLPVVVAEGDANTPIPSFSGAEYSVNCAQAVSAAAKIKGGYSLPFASIEAALSGGTATASAYTLDFSDGTFYSPVVAMWNGRTPDAPLPPNAVTAGKLFSTLAFWDWRTSNDTIQNPEIMEQIRGINIYERTEASSESRINASTKAGLSLPFVEASANAEGSVTRKVRFTSKKVRVGAFTDDPNPATRTRYFKIPAVADLESAASGMTAFSLVSSSPTGLTIYGTQQLPLTYRALGMAPEYCSKKWSVRDANGSKAYLALTSKAISIGAYGCDFVLNYLPTADDAKNGVVLKPEFTLIKGQGSSEKKISFSADELRLSPAEKPRLVPTWQVDPIATHSSGAYFLQIEYQIDDDGQLLGEKKDHVRLHPIQISCAGQTSVASVIHDVLRRDIVGRVLRLSLTIPGSETLDAVAKAGEKCTMGGEIELQIRGASGESVWIPRNVPTTPLMLRAPAPPPAPVP